MPIFEFRCLKCDECFELLVMNKSDQVEMRCPACQSEDFERVLSASCHSMSGNSTKNEGAAQSKTRSCPSGTCTTYDIPGPSR